MHRIAVLIAAAALSGAALAEDPVACTSAPPKSIALVICKSPMLNALDAELNRLYALATGPAGGASVPAVRSQQAPWLAARAACMKSKTRVACARDLTLARIDAIRAQSMAACSADAKGTSLGPFAFRCDTPDGMLSITYVNVKPGFAWIVRKGGASMLQQQRSGSGARYEGDGTLFWEAQGEARWRARTNDPEVACNRVQGPGK
ncbi:MAG: MliC family protein [Casimicrobiaceae bacterium]